MKQKTENRKINKIKRQIIKKQTKIDIPMAEKEGRYSDQ